MNHMTDIEVYSRYIVTRDDIDVQVIGASSTKCAYCGSQYEAWQHKCQNCGAPMQRQEPAHIYDRGMQTASCLSHGQMIISDSAKHVTWPLSWMGMLWQ